MSSLTRSPKHLPTLMAIAGLYKARGMLDEARTALQSALQIAEAGASISCSSGSGFGSYAHGSSKIGVDLLSSPAAAAAEAEEAAAGPSSELDDSSSEAADADEADRGLQLQSQPSNAGSALSHMSTSSNNGSDGSSDVFEVCQPDTASGAAAVPLATVKEALAVVLTDLGTRAKNAGRCAHCRCCRTIRSVTLLTSAHTSCSVILQLVRFPTTPCIPLHVHSSCCLNAVSGSILGANGGDKVRHVEFTCVALVVKTCTLPAHAAIHVRICSNVRLSCSRVPARLVGGCGRSWE
jgi:hypothetical protein